MVLYRALVRISKLWVQILGFTYETEDKGDFDGIFGLKMKNSEIIWVQIQTFSKSMGAAAPLLTRSLL